MRPSRDNGAYIRCRGELTVGRLGPEQLCYYIPKVSAIGITSRDSLALTLLEHWLLPCTSVVLSGPAPRKSVLNSALMPCADVLALPTSSASMGSRRFSTVTRLRPQNATTFRKS